MSSPESSPPSPPMLKIIDPTGDVILNVANECQVRVSSKVLSLVSKPFAAMFNGRFSEGKKLSAEDPPTIDLPEDNGYAMLWICRVIHGRRPSRHVSIKCEGEKTMKIAAQADKYLMLDAVSYALAEKVEECMVYNTYQDAEMLFLLVATYIMQDASSFRKVSAYVVFHCSYSSPVLYFVERKSSAITGRMPTLAYLLITNAITESRRTLFHSLRIAKDADMCTEIPWQNCYDSIGICLPADFQDLSDIVREWDEEETSLNSITEALEQDAERFIDGRRDDIIFDRLPVESDGDREFQKKLLKYAVNILQAAQHAILENVGLCLECVRAGRGGANHKKEDECK